MNWKEKEKKYTQEILRFLWKEGFATAEQVKKHIFTALTDKSVFHRRKLLKMENGGLIGRKKVLFSGFSVYYLNEKGFNRLDDEGAGRISLLHKEKISPTNPSGFHRLKCIDTRIELENLLPIDKYYSERMVFLSPVPYIRKPDFIFTAYGKRIAVEVELTYRSGKRYKQIFASWCYCLQKKRIDKILFLTDTKARAKSLPEKLKQIVKEQKESKKMLNVRVKTALKIISHRIEQVWIEESDVRNIGIYQIGEIPNEIKEFLKR